MSLPVPIAGNYHLFTVQLKLHRSPMGYYGLEINKLKLWFQINVINDVLSFEFGFEWTCDTVEGKKYKNFVENILFSLQNKIRCIPWMILVPKDCLSCSNAFCISSNESTKNVASIAPFFRMWMPSISPRIFISEKNAPTSDRLTFHGKPRAITSYKPLLLEFELLPFDPVA